MKFSWVITNDRSDVHAKGQGQRSKVKVTEVNIQLNRFRTVTLVWIHIWWWNDAYSLMMLRRGAFCFSWSSVKFQGHTALKPRSHCADHSLPMFPIIADRPDLSWSWQNHQIVALTPDLCLSKTASTTFVRQLYDTGMTEVFDPLLVRFPRPLVRPLIRSTRLHSRCWRPHPRSCRFATMIKTT